MRLKRKKFNRLLILICFVLVVVLIFLLKGRSNDKIEDNQVAEENLKGYTVEQQIQDEDAYIIETKYCDLYFPKKWESNIRYEIVEENIYKVMFYGNVNQKAEQKIFEICFGKVDGLLLGRFKKNGEEIDIYLITNDLEFSEKWTEEEKMLICSMQEDMNYLIGMLANEQGFRK